MLLALADHHADEGQLAAGHRRVHRASREGDGHEAGGRDRPEGSQQPVAAVRGSGPAAPHHRWNGRGGGARRAAAGALAALEPQAAGQRFRRQTARVANRSRTAQPGRGQRRPWSALARPAAWRSARHLASNSAAFATGSNTANGPQHGDGPGTGSGTASTALGMTRRSGNTAWPRLWHHGRAVSIAGGRTARRWAIRLALADGAAGRSVVLAQRPHPAAGSGSFMFATMTSGSSRSAQRVRRPSPAASTSTPMPTCRPASPWRRR